MPLDAARSDLRPVLVVEDCDDDFDTVRVAAARAKVGNRLVRAADAELAWQLLAGDPRESFAFVLLDFNLRGLDGLVLLGQVRRDRGLARLPVVVFTTSLNPRDRDLFCAAGASAFHVKSVQYLDGLRTVEAIFERWLNRAARPAPAPISSPTRRLE